MCKVLFPPERNGCVVDRFSVSSIHSIHPEYLLTPPLPQAPCPGSFPAVTHRRAAPWHLVPNPGFRASCTCCSPAAWHAYSGGGRWGGAGRVGVCEQVGTGGGWGRFGGWQHRGRVRGGRELEWQRRAAQPVSPKVPGTPSVARGGGQGSWGAG